MTTLSKRTKQLMIDAIIDHAPKKGRAARRRELNKGSDTLLLLEYQAWVDPNLPSSLYAVADAIGALQKEKK